LKYFNKLGDINTITLTTLSITQPMDGQVPLVPYQSFTDIPVDTRKEIAIIAGVSEKSTIKSFNKSIDREKKNKRKKRVN
jgi:hypothetical protein